MSLATSAAAYAARGLAIFPCAPGKKLPLFRGGEGFKDATSDQETVARWWRENPDANIGLPCEPNGLVALDVDPRNGGDDTMRRLVTELGRLPETIEAKTGGGGRHVLFASPGRPLRGALGPGVDIKSNGYVLVAPSIHPSGDTYAWIRGRGPDKIAPAPLPPAWLERVGKIRHQERGEEAAYHRASGETTAYGRAALDAEYQALAHAPQGRRNETLNRSAFCLGQLVGGGEIAEADARATLEQACRINRLLEDEPRKTTGSLEGGLRAGMAEPRAAAPGEAHYSAEDAHRDWMATAAKTTEGFPVVLAANIKPRKMEWLVEGALGAGQCGFLTGLPGTYKSWATAELLISVASGTRAFGTLKAQSGVALVYNAEDDPAIITRDRLDRLARGRSLKLSDLPLYLVDTDTVRLDQNEDVLRLRRTVADLKASLLVLDPLRNLHWAKEDSSTEMTPILAGVRSIQRETGCTVLLVHHDRKGSDERRESRVRGSNSLEGWRDFALYADTATERVVTIRPYVKGCVAPPPWSFTILDGPDGSASAITTSKSDAMADKLLRLLRERPGGITAEEARELLAVRRCTADQVLSMLVSRCSVVASSESRRRGNGKPYPVDVYRAVDGAWDIANVCPEVSQ